MTNRNLTYIQGIVDRSGSMQSIKTDTEGGWNAFIEAQKEVPGECYVSLAQFDDRYDVVYEDKPLHYVPQLSLQPRGSTALRDAIGRTVTELGARLARLPEYKRPGSVVVAVLTDGLENASREWYAPALKQLIEQQTNQYGWLFKFMGANQDAVLTGAELGFLRDHSLTYAGQNVKQAFTSTSNSIGAYRGAISSGEGVLVASAAAAYSTEDRDEAVGSTSK